MSLSSRLGRLSVCALSLIAVVAAEAAAGSPRPLRNVGEQCALEGKWTYAYRIGNGPLITVSGSVRWRRATYAVSNRLYTLWPEVPAVSEPSLGLRIFRSGSETPLTLTSTEAGLANRRFLAVADLMVLTPRGGGYLVRWFPKGLPLPGRSPLTAYPAAALPARVYSHAALAASRVVLALTGTKRFDFVDAAGRYRGTLSYSLRATF